MPNLTGKNFYRCHLPHWHPGKVSSFITFRLVGSLPRDVLDTWRKESKPPSESKSQRWQRRRQWFRKFESLLHQGASGPLWLGDSGVAQMIAECLHYRHDRVFFLDCFCIMPNHVHMVINPLIQQGEPSTSALMWGSIPGIMHSLKSYTAHEANKMLGRTGPFWAKESFDHWLRSLEHWQRAVSYVMENPVRAGLATIPSEYPWSFSRFGYPPLS
ncbi:Y1-Tnp domain-containing protein [Sulfidibacter corallicola]|uniref:Transposase IS200-like domain-containing protein n=1 Tax=Sulfidibacter corallicola TaxID=2818388 RepID=A0A8A4TU78_SULCO|nr:hypothetical protein [Sulfidibacter corallicola]QTD52694.1 hypothetical protein J3U87_09480 [Sulfidibacter corallicola]